LSVSWSLDQCCYTDHFVRGSWSCCPVLFQLCPHVYILYHWYITSDGSSKHNFSAHLVGIIKVMIASGNHSLALWRSVRIHEPECRFRCDKIMRIRIRKTVTALLV
jgi:hypothetical protein